MARRVVRSQDVTGMHKEVRVLQVENQDDDEDQDQSCRRSIPSSGWSIRPGVSLSWMMGINSAAELIWKVLVGVCILCIVYVRHYSMHLILLRQNGQIMFGLVRKDGAKKKKEKL